VGFDHNEKHCQSALELGLVEKIVDFEEVKNSDVIILAIPVEAIIKAMDSLREIRQDTTVIDLGSTKEKIVAAIPNPIRPNFVAAHPMTGTEKFGPHAALPDLYEEKIVVLCDLQDCDQLHVMRALELFNLLNMKIVKMDAKEHDLHAAFISHMPHALSFALARAVLAQQDPKSILTLAAGGFKDMSRLAKSSPDMWTDIFKQNKHNLLHSLKHFQQELDSCTQMIEDEDFESLHRWIAQSNKLHHIL
jgi:prephenate dehydrogenase